MLVKVPRDDIDNYRRKYFLEADTTDRKNVRSISISDNGKPAINGDELEDDDIEIDDEDDELSEDDVAGLDDEDDDIATDDSDDSTPDDGGDNTDDGAGDDNTNTDTDDNGDDGDDIALDEDDDTDNDNDDTGTDDDGGTNDNGGGDDSGDDNGDADDGDGDEIATDDSDDSVPDDNGDNGGDSSGDDSGDDSGMSPEERSENIRKKSLFRSFNDLYDTLGKYIEKMNMLMAYGTDATPEYRKIADQLTEIQSYVYDYMLIKFTTNKYIQSMLFYQRAITATTMVVNDLDKITVANKNSENNQTKHNSKQN
jgi:hypothetical protein